MHIEMEYPICAQSFFFFPRFSFARCRRLLILSFSFLSLNPFSFLSFLQTDVAPCSSWLILEKRKKETERQEKKRKRDTGGSVAARWQLVRLILHTQIVSLKGFPALVNYSQTCSSSKTWFSCKKGILGSSFLFNSTQFGKVVEKNQNFLPPRLPIIVQVSTV